MRQGCQPLALMCISVCFAFSTVANIASANMDAVDQADIWTEVAEDIGEDVGGDDSKDKVTKWSISLGVVGGFSPDYEGSDDYEFGVGPDFAVSWQDRVFYKGKSLGANLIRNENLKAGPIVSWDSGRDEDDNDKLEGLGDVDSSVEVGGFISYRMKPMRFRLEARQDIDSGHEGALVELSGGTNLPFKKLRVFMSLGATWASDDYMESFFGVSSSQSASSGLKQYNADSGIKDVKVGLTTGYSITQRWRVGGKVEYKRLVGDAADSPIVDDENQFLAGLSLSYHWGSGVEIE